MTADDPKRQAADATTMIKAAGCGVLTAAAVLTVALGLSMLAYSSGKSDRHGDIQGLPPELFLPPLVFIAVSWPALSVASYLAIRRPRSLRKTRPPTRPAEKQIAINPEAIATVVVSIATAIVAACAATAILYAAGLAASGLLNFATDAADPYRILGLEAELVLAVGTFVTVTWLMLAGLSAVAFGRRPAPG